LIADEHRIDNSPRPPAGVQEAQPIVMPDRHRDTFQLRVPGALPGHASNPTPGVPRTEASQTPTVGDSDHRRGQPTGMPPVGIRAIVISNGGATDNQRPPARVQEAQTMATRDRHHNDNPPTQLSRATANLFRLCTRGHRFGCRQSGHQQEETASEKRHRPQQLCPPCLSNSCHFRKPSGLRMALQRPLHRDSRRSTVTSSGCRGGSGKPAARHG
jgi:hypothetical protein